MPVKFPALQNKMLLCVARMVSTYFVNPPFLLKLLSFTLVPFNLFLSGSIEINNTIESLLNLTNWTAQVNSMVYTVITIFFIRVFFAYKKDKKRGSAFNGASS